MIEIAVSQAAGRVPVTILTIKGAITSNSEIEQQADAVYAAGARNILLDMTDVPYVATAGLRALHYIYILLRTDAPEENDEAVAAGIRAGTFYSPHLKLLKPSVHVLEALKVAGYDMFLEFYTDRTKAIESF